MSSVYKKLPSRLACSTLVGSRNFERQRSVAKGGDRGTEGAGIRSTWEDLLHKIDVVRQQSPDTHPLLMKYDVSIAGDIPLHEASRLAKELLDHAQKGIQLTFFKRLLKPERCKFQEKITANSQPPSDLEHFKAVQIAIQLQQGRLRLKEKWQRHMTQGGSPPTDELGDSPEGMAFQFMYRINRYLFVPDERMPPQ